MLVAVSGGPDSTTLLSTALHELPRRQVGVGAVTVDHGLQAGSATRARTVADEAVRAGADPVEVVHVRVGTAGGPEAAARRSRRAALLAAAQRHGAVAVLLGHTLDDQAETVLLGLARGSGGRSLAGMAAHAGVFRRPFLGLPRVQVHAAAERLAAEVWLDPHNEDSRYRRVRVRQTVLPVLESELGPGIAAALARSADLLRADADALDEWTDRVAAEALGQHADRVWVEVAMAAALPQAIRYRLIRRAATRAGSPPSDLTMSHVAAVDRLVVAWKGQSWVDLPGGLRASRSGPLLDFSPASPRTS